MDTKDPEGLTSVPPRLSLTASFADCVCVGPVLHHQRRIYTEGLTLMVLSQKCHEDLLCKNESKKEACLKTVLACRVKKLLSIALAVNSSRSGTDLQRLPAKGCCSQLEDPWSGRNLDWRKHE